MEKVKAVIRKVKSVPRPKVNWVAFGQACSQASYTVYRGVPVGINLAVNQAKKR